MSETETKKDCKLEALEEKEPITQAHSLSEPKYCQIALHVSGNIYLEGDKGTVNALIEAMKKEGYIIDWKYRSICG
ncbi:MAG: hypothetical protein ABIN18_01155 [Pseudomonadota bacterium]